MIFSQGCRNPCARGCLQHWMIFPSIFRYNNRNISDLDWHFLLNWNIHNLEILDIHDIIILRLQNLQIAISPIWQKMSVQIWYISLIIPKNWYYSHPEQWATPGTWIFLALTENHFCLILTKKIFRCLNFLFLEIGLDQYYNSPQ